MTYESLYQQLLDRMVLACKRIAERGDLTTALFVAKRWGTWSSGDRLHLLFDEPPRRNP